MAFGKILKLLLRIFCQNVGNEGDQIILINSIGNNRNRFVLTPHLTGTVKPDFYLPFSARRYRIFWPGRCCTATGYLNIGNNERLISGIGKLKYMLHIITLINIPEIMGAFLKG